MKTISSEDWAKIITLLATKEFTKEQIAALNLLIDQL